MNSILVRLAVWLGLGLTVTLGLTWVFANRVMEQVGERFLVEDLRHDTEGLLLALEFDAEGRPRMDTARVEPVFQRPFSGHYYRIEAGGGSLVSRSLWDGTLDVPPGEGRWRLPGPQGQRLFVVSAHYEKGGHRFRLVVAEDVTAIGQVVDRMRRRYAAAVGLLGIVLGLGLIWVLRGAVRPLDRLRRDCRALQAGELRALSLERVPREIRPLVEEINILLDVLRERLDHQRHALGNLAHAIKTPLTVILQRVRALERDGPPPCRSQARILREAAESIGRVAERELQRARAAGGAGAVAPAPLRRTLEELLRVLRQAHVEKALRFELAVPGELRVRMDREDLMEVLGNILDNAAKWARRRVRVSAEGGPAVIVRVEDDGPGVAPEAAVAVLGRGRRLDESAPGHGLGLAIARDLMARYGGTLRMERSEALGGLSVYLMFSDGST